MGVRDEVTVWESNKSDSLFRFGEQVALSGWPRLWTFGDREMLDSPLLGFFCSRQCPGEVILRTYDLARALRDASVPVIGGFHSPMEAECLELLLRGGQPVVVCPARSIESMRMPALWKKSVAQGRLLILSPFPNQHRRPTTSLAEKRNRLVAQVARTILVAHAAPKSKIEAFCRQLLSDGKPMWTFDTPTAEPIRALGARCFPAAQANISALHAPIHDGGEDAAGGRST